MRKIQNDQALYNSNDTVTISDSMGDYRSGYGVQATNLWQYQLERLLLAEGYPVTARSFAKAGYTTAQLMCYVGAAFLYSTPKLVQIYAGVNDATGSNSTATGTTQAGSTSTTIKLAAASRGEDFTFVGNVITITSGTGAGQSRTIINYIGATVTATVDSAWTTTPDATSVYSIAAPTQAQQQRNHQGLIKAAKYRAIGKSPKTGESCAVWSQGNLPADGEPGQRYVVLYDNSTNSGAAKYLGFHNENQPGDFSASPKVTVWEFRRKLAGSNGWGRVAVDGTPAFTDGVANVIVVSTNYLNFSSGGDTAGVPYAPYVPVRAAQSAAAAAEGVVYCNLYDYQSKLITGGIFQGVTIAPFDTQGSNSWHAANSDQHHNTYGNATVAEAVLLTIKANQNIINAIS